MEGIYKHTKTGAEQILTDSIAELLGGSEIWEFIGEFIPSLQTPVVAEPSLQVADLQRLADASQVETDSEKENKVREVYANAKVEAKAKLGNVETVVSKPKAVSLKDLDE